MFSVRQIATNIDFLVFYVSVMKNTMNPSKDNINSVLVLPRTSAVSYVHEHIIAQMELAADYSDLAYRLSNEPARTKHALVNNDDMARAWQSLGHATDVARSVQPTMYIHNTVCRWFLTSKHREALPADDLGCPSKTDHGAATEGSGEGQTRKIRPFSERRDISSPAQLHSARLKINCGAAPTTHFAVLSKVAINRSHRDPCISGHSI